MDTPPFQVSHICILNEAYPQSWRGITGNGDVTHQDRDMSHWEWPYDSQILTGYGDVPHQECTSSPRMHIAYTGCSWASHFVMGHIWSKHADRQPCNLPTIQQKKPTKATKVNTNSTNYSTELNFDIEIGH